MLPGYCPSLTLWPRHISPIGDGRTAMGAKIVGFILYLALSYGVIYVLTSKRFLSEWRFLREWNVKEPQLKAAIVAAIVLIIAVGTMLVGPLPMVLMVVALVAFIDYVRSSESLSATACDRMPSWRMPPGLAASLESSRQWLTKQWLTRQWLTRRSLTDASTSHGFVRILHPVLPVARRTLAAGVDRLSGYFRSLTTRAPDHRNGGDLSAPANDHGHTAQAPPVQVQPPPLSLAEGHGLFAVRTALTPTKQVERMPTREEAKRLLDRLEGRV
jgi:hypothetical protein